MISLSYPSHNVIIVMIRMYLVMNIITIIMYNDVYSDD